MDIDYLELIDKVYEKGWYEGGVHDYDPRGAKEWQAAVDAIYDLKKRLAAAESRIAELVSGIKEAQIELIETGKIYALGLSCKKRRVTELEQRLAAVEAMNKKLAKFFIGAIECSFEGCDYDGRIIQDDALELGLIEECAPPDGEESPWYKVTEPPTNRQGPPQGGLFFAQGKANPLATIPLYRYRVLTKAVKRKEPRP